MDRARAAQTRSHATPDARGNGAPHAPAAPAPARATQRPDLGENSRIFNRDLSWLEFNRRVLQLALDEKRALLERVKFLAIFSSNLDEFVMKRVGLLEQRIEEGFAPNLYEPWDTAVLLQSIRDLITELQHTQTRCFLDTIRPALAAEGIHLLAYTELDEDARRRIDAWFAREVFPILTPLAVDPGHRFPFISNQSENIGVLVAEEDHAEPLFARIKVPTVLPQWVRVPPGDGEAPEGKGRGRFVHLQDLIRNNLDDLFPGMKIAEVCHFRVIRNAEVEAEDDDADNLLELVEAQLKQRRFAQAVRLEISMNPSRRLLSHLIEELGISPAAVAQREGPLDYNDLMEIVDLDRPDLKDPPWRPVVPRRLADTGRDIFSIIRDGDLLLHHPYESFEASAQRFITEAARDPNVLAIKQTIYRTSRDSPFIHSLMRAAEHGKQVACLVELRARFDEQSNVRFAQMLEKAGVHVAYGVVGLKTHCKAALVVRREEDPGGGTVLRAYAHLGTGNYHPRTASLYTDLSLFTCNPLITDDVVDMFNFLTGRSKKSQYRSLLVAPLTMKPGLMARIDREMEIAQAFREGRSPVNGRVVAKMNALEDRTVTEKLYDASAAGVDITLFVRGFCCLRPRLPGLSDNIRVVSVVGRFLEHSRIFHFGAGKQDPLEGEWFISSADWMYRNLNNRVEAATPILDPRNRAKLAAIFDVMGRDCRRAWDLNPDGSYTLRTPPEDADPDSPEAIGTFETLMRAAAAGQLD